MMKKISEVTFFLAVILLPLHLYAADDQNQIVVADFDKGEAVNNLGQPVEVWLKDDGSDATQKTTLSFASDDAAGNPQGHSAAIEYDVDSENPAYNGIRMGLNNLDLREFKSLRFFIKGDKEKGFGSKFKIELISSQTKAPSPYLFDGVTDKWQEVVVPLSDFFAIGDKSSLAQFTVVFADIINAPKVGKVYLDQVSFSKD